MSVVSSSVNLRVAAPARAAAARRTARTVVAASSADKSDATTIPRRCAARGPPYPRLFSRRSRVDAACFVFYPDFIWRRDKYSTIQNPSPTTRDGTPPHTAALTDTQLSPPHTRMPQKLQGVPRRGVWSPCRRLRFVHRRRLRQVSGRG